MTIIRGISNSFIADSDVPGLLAENKDVIKKIKARYTNTNVYSIKDQKTLDQLKIKRAYLKKRLAAIQEANGKWIHKFGNLFRPLRVFVLFYALDISWARLFHTLVPDYFVDDYFSVISSINL